MIELYKNIKFGSPYTEYIKESNVKNLLVNAIGFHSQKYYCCYVYIDNKLCFEIKKTVTNQNSIYDAFKISNLETEHIDRVSYIHFLEHPLIKRILNES